jgi:hypothetical protein
VGDDEHERGSGAELEEELLEGGSAVVEGESIGWVLRGDALAGEVGGVLELGVELGRLLNSEGNGEQECG